MNAATMLPLIIPLAAAAATLIALRNLRVKRIISLTASTAFTAVAGWLLVAVDSDGANVVGVGGWAPPFGIALVADRLSALLLFTSAIALLAVLVYAVSQRSTDEELAGFHAVYQVLTAGVALTLLTGDLFTLFVAFEMMLTASRSDRRSPTS